MLVEPGPYKCVGSGKKLLMSTDTFVNVTRDSEVKKIMVLYGRGNQIS